MTSGPDAGGGALPTAPRVSRLYSVQRFTVSANDLRAATTASVTARARRYSSNLVEEAI